MSRQYVGESPWRCAVCDSENIDYGDSEIADGQIMYEYKCMDCKCSGTEYYSMQYIETIAYNENEEE